MSATGPGFEVTRENVLQAYALFASEARRLRKTMDENGRKLYIEECGKDPVSLDAVKMVNPKLEALRDQCHEYVKSLQNTADQLYQAAKAYGFTEDDISRSFGSTASPAPRPLLTPDPMDPLGTAMKPYMPPSPRAASPLVNPLISRDFR